MRVCVINWKGGSGRTTLALNLAGFYVHNCPESRVLVADCDDTNQSSLAWASLSDETPFTVGRTRSRGFDNEILDMGPRKPANGVLPQADVYVVPTKLDGSSYVAFLSTMAMLEEQSVPVVVVANQINDRRAEHRNRLKNEPALQGAVEIRDRAAWVNYYGAGATVFTMPGKHVLAAREEIGNLAAAIAFAVERKAQ